MSRFTLADLRASCEMLGFTLEKATPIYGPPGSLSRRRYRTGPGHDYVVRGNKEDNIGFDKSGALVPKKKGYIFANVHTGGSSGGDFRMFPLPKHVRTEQSAETWLRNTVNFNELLNRLLYNRS